MSDPTVEWLHVQPLLEAACSQMDVGQMVHTSTFSLFEAMSAVEVGNPKMDAGAQPKTDNLPLADRPLNLDLTQEQLLSIMDHLLCLEATWQTGSSLAQTLYSSLYMMQLPRLSPNVALSAFCRAVEATCLEVNRLVTDGCVCEEEDFNPHTAGLPIESAATTSTSDKCLAALSLAIDASGNQPTHSKQGPPGGQRSSMLAAALVARLQFRKLLFQGISKLQRKQKQDLDMAHKLFLKALTELDNIRDSMHLASSDILGFDESLNSHLDPPVPPRVVKVKSRQDAFSYYETLLKQLIRVCSVTYVTDYLSLKLFLESYSNLLPCAVARSALHVQLMAKSFEGASPPAWAPSLTMLKNSTGIGHSPDLLTADAQLFLEQALIAVGNWCQSMLLNRARQRRRLRRGLEDWGNLYQHALNADLCPEFQKSLSEAGWHWEPQMPDDTQGPLAAWVERETAYCMVWHLLLGFELELYEPREYVMIFWYCDYLCSIIIQDRKSLQAAKPQHAIPANGSPRKLNKKPKSKQAATNSAASQVPSGQYLWESVLLDCWRYMCQGMMRMILSCNVSSTLTWSELPFNTDMQRFDQRFAGFHVLARPDPLGYDQYEQSVDTTGVSNERLTQLAVDAFNKARRACAVLKSSQGQWGASEEQLQNVIALDKVAMQDMVALGILSKAIVGTSQFEPAFENSHHKWFPSVALKSARKQLAQSR